MAWPLPPLGGLGADHPGPGRRGPGRRCRRRPVVDHHDVVDQRHPAAGGGERRTMMPHDGARRWPPRCGPGCTPTTVRSPLASASASRVEVAVGAPDARPRRVSPRSTWLPSSLTGPAVRRGHPHRRPRRGPARPGGRGIDGCPGVRPQWRPSSRAAEGPGPATPRQPERDDRPAGRSGRRTRCQCPSDEETAVDFVSGLRCRECGRAYPAEALHVCDFCFGPLEVTYDYERVAATITRERVAAGPAVDLALRRPPAGAPTPARSTSARGSPRWSGPTAWPPSWGSVSSGSRTTRPTRPDRSRTGWCRWP